MPGRREIVLDAAIEVLATGGARSLTHRAVDSTAGVPAGSTSNLFRTRSALVAGVLARVSEIEQGALAELDAPGRLGAPELTAMAAAMVEDALGPGRTRSLARRALFHEAAADPDVAESLLAASEFWWRVVGGLLIRAGVPEPETRGRLLLAYLDGVIADQLARPDPAFDAVTSLAPAVSGIVHHPASG